MTLSPSLQPLAAYPQWVTWRLEWNAERDKYDKIPYSPRHAGRASSTDPSHWTSYDNARTFQHAVGHDGVGFVLSADDPFYFLDIDGAAQPDGTWSPLALDLCQRLTGAAVEVSQSGAGLHIIGSLTARPEHGCRNTARHLELYTAERFIAVTDNGTIGDASALCDTALAPIIVEHFAPRASGSDTAGAEWTDTPCPEWSGYTDDAELLAAALKSGKRSAAAVFGDTAPSQGGGRVTFEDLWTGNGAALGQMWPPDNNVDPFNRSSADQALANHLAFWTGRNCERIRSLMFQSDLVRDKWDRADYIPATILHACGYVRDVHQRGGTPDPEPPEPASSEIAERLGITLRHGPPIRAYNEQMEMWAGHYYVETLNKIFTPSGALLDKPRFDVRYGGFDFVHTQDGSKTTDSAWEAFTQSQVIECPKVDALCFRPELGAGGTTEESGRLLLNSHTALEPDEQEGDPAPFLDFLARILPDPNDRDILVHYIASMSQNIGRKFFWWPVLQGAEGNGKSLVVLVMRHVAGERYSHLPNATKMVSGNMNFNGWIDRKLFIGMEEVKAANRREFFESFKTTVSNPTLPVEAKGVEEATKDNRANGVICTNYKDGVLVDDGSRRYAVFFTAQQEAAHLERDGMTSAYFADLYDWLYGRGKHAEHGPRYGLRVVLHYLRRYQLRAELDPARLATRAPRTSSMAEAVVASRGMVEQEVLEAVEEERTGFAGGWISSIKLDALLEAKRLHVPRNKRRDMLATLGYQPHPVLQERDGRIGRVVMPDNAKPRLYCKTGSVAWKNLHSQEAVAEAYTKAQLSAAGGHAGAGRAAG